MSGRTETPFALVTESIWQPLSLRLDSHYASEDQTFFVLFFCFFWGGGLAEVAEMAEMVVLLLNSLTGEHTIM